MEIIMKIVIENLSYHREYLDIVVDWLYSKWGNNNYNYWKSWVESSLSVYDVPQTFVILVDGEIAGTYSLWRCDLQSRQDLFPWFGGLYVTPKYRGKSFNGTKLGEHMLLHAREQLQRLGYKEAYLFTEKDAKYYVRNGWVEMGITQDEKDNNVCLCKLIVD